MRVSRGRGGFEDISRAGLRGFRARVTRHTVSIRFFGGGIFMATLPSRCVSRGGVRVQASTIDETRSNCFSSRRERSRSSAFASRSAPSALRARIADAEARSERTRAGCASQTSPLARAPGLCEEPSSRRCRCPVSGRRSIIFRSRKTSGLTQQLAPPVSNARPLDHPGGDAEDAQWTT